MRRSKLLLGAAVAALVGVSGVAHASHVGVFIGGSVPFYYPVAPAPYYYGPPAVIVAPAPSVAPDYIEQAQPQAGAPATNPQGPGSEMDAQQVNSDTWYFCDDSKTYYPYVRQCSSGWRAVPAQPAPSN